MKVRQGVWMRWLLTTAGLAASAAALWAAGEEAAAGVAVATGAAADTVSKVQPQSPGIMQLMHNGGFLMWVIAAMSVLAVAVAIYQAYTLRVSLVVPRFLHREIIEKIRAGNLDDVRRACEYRPCALSAIVLAAVDYMRNAQHVDTSLLKDVMEGEGARQADSLMGQTQFLYDIAVVAPMAGLLGTVFGMIQAFSGVALDIASAKPVILAAGVSKALLTTAFGLIVALPAMAIYAYFRRQATKIVSMLEVASTDVMTALSNKSTR